jgi:short-subunit dehydrogenase
MSTSEYALVTGASSGIGEELARQLAARGWSLVLVARSLDRLERLRSELQTAHPAIDVRCIGMDLSMADAPGKLFAETQSAGIEITLLINNAGFGAFGEFANLSRERFRQMIDLNISALVELTHLYLQPMTRQSAAQRHRGGIVNIASVASYTPLPYSAVYAATKAFVRSFSMAIFEEARQHGVRVLVVHPGTTATNFFEVAGKSPYNHPLRMQTPAQVVAESLRALDQDRRSVVTGTPNRILVGILKVIPAACVTLIIGQLMRRSLQRTK